MNTQHPDATDSAIEDVREITIRLLPGLKYLARRRMLVPALLFLSSHSPLAFVTGQALWLFTPFELLAPDAHLRDWARVLSHPQGSVALKRLVEDALADETTAR